MENKTTGFAERAGMNGLSLGIYLAILAMISGLSVNFWYAGFLLWGLTFALPFFMYSHLRRSYGRMDFSLSLGQLWAEGTLSFFLGAAIQAAAVYLVLTFLTPHFVENLFDTGLESLRQLNTAETNALAAQYEQIRTQFGLPKPVDVAYNLMFFNLIIGMLMSFAVSLILTFRYRDGQRRQKLTEYLQKHPY